MNRFLVRRECDFYTTRYLIISGAIIGSAVPILLCVVILIFPPLREASCMVSLDWQSYLALGFLALYPALFLGFIARRWSYFRNPPLVAVWGIASGLALGLSWMLAECVAGEPDGLLMQELRRGNIARTFFWFATSHALAAALFWGLVCGYYKLRGIEILLQDGHTCPQCTYNLTGNISMVCPECGNPFTWDELSTPGEIA